MITLFKNTKLKNIVKVYSGNSINKKIKEKNYTGIENGVDYISTKDIGFNYSINYDNGVKIPFNKIKSFKIAPKNTVFICAEGGSAGRKIAISNRELCFVNKLFAIVVSDKVIPKYIFYSIISKDFITQFKTQATGIIGGVSINKFKELEISLPPIPIQHKIVEKLDAIFAEIDKATAAAEVNVKNAEALFQSQLGEIVTGEDDWSLYTLREVCDIARGGSPRPIDKFITELEDGINWVKISDATRSKKYIYETRQKIKKAGVSHSRFVDDGDFLLSNSMSFGRPYIMRTTGCIHDGWLVLSKYQKRLDIDFFYYLLSSPVVVSQFENLAKGSTVRNLNIELVSGVRIKIPSIQKQKMIASKLHQISTEVDNLKQFYQKKEIQLKLLKQSILKQAFNGELVKAA